MTKNLLIRKLFHAWFLFKRPMTLGVRILVENDAGEILLVRHTYVSGWYLPGGGVETKETAEDAVRKELLEEAGIAVKGEVKLLGVYLNRRASKRDHVLLYKCSDWIDTGQFKPNREIAEIAFFSLNELPEDTTPATKTRIDEIYGKSDVSAYW